jgi:Alpha-amylase/alpha-mannosidase
MNNNLTKLILHGHFYQPPRENPSTGLIPKQPSAYPFEDWNEKITAECYEANCNSRYLSTEGRIVSLTNNFEYISYNFGPTLLSWLEKNRSDVYEKIIDADRKSLKRLGHGNAMAQGFNHTILPLDNEKDAKLQIDWGIADFINRYKRDPEGLWLPECGINGPVIDLLSTFGIKFVVLSPWQCKAVETENGIIVDLAGGPAPFFNSYILTGPKGGTVSAFFYNPTLSSDISFGHALRDADDLYEKLLSIRDSKEVSLIHAATDGEIYGHHEPYGDMALAALIKKCNERNDFEMTNYGTLLAERPATLHAVLKDGDDGKGTSWSCSHGVSRWFKDCGCHTGGEDGWNQKWRTPLRNALRNNGTRIDSIFKYQTEKMFSGKLSSEELLHIAAPAITGAVEMSSFVKSLHSKFEFNSEYDDDIANLLTGQKNKHFSFTSCGFFFSDISGIEPKQDIAYALYAIKLYQKYYKEDLLLPFLIDLNEAKSNIKSEGTGMTLAQSLQNEIPGEVEASLFFFLNNTMATMLKKATVYGRFSLARFEKKEEFSVVEIIDSMNLSRQKFKILSSASLEHGLNLYFSNADDTKSVIKVTSENIPERLFDTATIWLLHNYQVNSIENFILSADNIINYCLIAGNGGRELDEEVRKQHLMTSFRIIEGLLNNFPGRENTLKLEYIEKLANLIHAIGNGNDRITVRKLLTGRFDAIATEMKKSGLTREIAEETESLLKVSRNLSIEPDLRKIQNETYLYLRGEKKCPEAEDRLKSLSDALNFA